MFVEYLLLPPFHNKYRDLVQSSNNFVLNWDTYYGSEEVLTILHFTIYSWDAIVCMQGRYTLDLM